MLKTPAAGLSQLTRSARKPTFGYEAETETTVESTDDKPAITTHVEPPEHGACTYYRCVCGRVALRRKDLRSEAHLEECDA